MKAFLVENWNRIAWLILGAWAVAGIWSIAHAIQGVDGSLYLMRH